MRAIRSSRLTQLGPLKGQRVKNILQIAAVDDDDDDLIIVVVMMVKTLN